MVERRGRRIQEEKHKEWEALGVRGTEGGRAIEETSSVGTQGSWSHGNEEIMVKKWQKERALSLGKRWNNPGD